MSNQEAPQGGAVSEYTTEPCMACGKTSMLHLSSVALSQWQGGAMIQDAFGDLSAPAREQIKTGTHPACWDAMFEGMDDD